MTKKIIYVAAVLCLVACSESLEDQAEREAKEYTERLCPTPYLNNSRTDSAVFEKSTRTYTYYISLRGEADNEKVISANKQKLHALQKEALDNNPGLKKYKEAHFAFRFVYHSASSPQKILLDNTFKYD